MKCEVEMRYQEISKEVSNKNFQLICPKESVRQYFLRKFFKLLELTDDVVSFKCKNIKVSGFSVILFSWYHVTDFVGSGFNSRWQYKLRT
jgi:hypothetical protein